jgi:uncharacterized membrane protein
MLGQPMFRLSFIYPEMLWLLAFVPALWALALTIPRRLPGWRFYSSLGLRTALMLALILAIAGVQLVRPVSQLTTVFLLDGSDSLSASARAQAEGFIQEALASKAEADQAAIVVFGGNALVERAPSVQDRLGRVSSVPIATRTNLEDAIQLGLALFPADTQKRLVLLSDGGENDGSAIEASRLAAARGVPIEVLDLAQPGTDAEVLVAQIDAPARARDGQSLTVNATVESNQAQRAIVRLLVEQTVVGEQTVDLLAGSNQVSFTNVAASGSGFKRFRVQVEAAGDSRAQNNEAAALVQIQGPPRVLVVAQEDRDADALIAALTATQMIPEQISPGAMPQDLAGLSPYEAVVLVNVPARSLPVGTMAALPGYVRDLGKGLVMIGGNDSYGVGGYGRTPVEEAMPVYMDVRDKDERPDLAIVFVIDKSGSMDACHCSSPERTAPQLSLAGERKVDIAKEAVAQAAALLGPRDTLGVVAFDTVASSPFPATLNPDINAVIDAVGPLEPRGSTNVRAGLIEAEEMLNGVDARIKHVILLTDGWGGGGDQRDIAERMRANGMTLSVVAAGGGSADYLERLAETGGGRYYPAQDMAEVPQIFVQETITTVGNYIIERPTSPLLISDSPIIAGISSTPQLYGYNGSTLKDTARLVLADSDDSPLLATWQYGLGRSVAWLSDTSPRWGQDWVLWEGFPRFAGQLVGWALPVRGGQEVTTELQVLGSETELRLTVDETIQASLSVTATLIGGDGSRQELGLRQVGPGAYQGRLESPPPGTYLVQIAGTADDRAVVQEVAGLVVPYSAEYRSNQGNAALLSELAALTDGHTLSAGAEAFAPLQGNVTRAQEIGLPLLILALLLLPLDIALRRVMLRRSDLGSFGALLPQRAAAPSAPSPVDTTLNRLAGAKQRANERMAPPPAPAPPAERTTNQPPAPPPQSAPGASLDRLREAKERARRKIDGGE